MFDFDPDDLIERIEEQENYDPDGLIDDVETEEEEVDDSIVEKAIIAGAIFGMGIEEGRAEVGEEMAAKKLSKGERSPGAVSLRNLEKSAGRKKLRPFEQWVDDVIHGRKTLDDDL